MKAISKHPCNLLRVCYEFGKVSGERDERSDHVILGCCLLVPFTPKISVSWVGKVI